MTTSFVKDSGLIRMNHTYQIRKQTSMEKRFVVRMVRLSRYNSLWIFEVKLNNYYRYIYLIAKWKKNFKNILHSSIAKTSFFYIIIHYHIQQGQLKKKFLNLDDQFYYIHFISRILPQQTIIFSVLCKTFWIEKLLILTSKLVRLLKISSSSN